MEPELQTFAASNAWHVKTGTINIDACPQLATRFSVTAVPTLIVFRDGKVTLQASGFTDKAELEELLVAK